MRKLIINLSVLLFIALPITLIGSYTLAYELLINQMEDEEMINMNNIKVKCGKCGHKSIDKTKCEKCDNILIKNYNVNEFYPELQKLNYSLCDGCLNQRETTSHTLKGINTKVNLCDDCLEVFTELEKEEQND